jgi:hypothetical protein
VLSAGNIAAIGAMDVITWMFDEGRAYRLMMHPVNAIRDGNGAQGFVTNSHCTVVRAGEADGHLFIRAR